MIRVARSTCANVNESEAGEVQSKGVQSLGTTWLLEKMMEQDERILVMAPDMTTDSLY